MTVQEKAKQLYPDALDDDLYPMKLQWRVNDARGAYIEGYNEMSSQLEAYKESLTELLEASEELATIIHMITRKQGDAINKAKSLLNP